MPFHSLYFLPFFLITIAVYFILPGKWRWVVLLCAGIIFYAWAFPPYLIVAAAMITINYFSARWIEQSKEGKKFIAMLAGVLTTLLLLAAFKYTHFFTERIMLLASSLHLLYPSSMMKVLIPLGISFQSFMAMAYIFEVYRGHIKAERHFGIFSLYLLFFPIAASGPIERPQHLIPQFRAHHTFDIPQVSSGLRLIVWGFFKKLVIADRLGVFVTMIYKDPGAYEGFPLIWGTFFFALQIYSDFSSYTDIARGTARILGFQISENFNTPYFSTSVTEFWRRWHITLSGWLRDYLFTPLSVQFRRLGKFGLLLSLLITFILCGIWHGAGWTFLIWGTLHGLAMVIESLFSKPLKKKKKKGNLLLLIKMLITFLFLYFSWIFFRAETLQDSLQVFSGIWKIKPSVLIGVPLVSTYSFILILLAALILIMSDIIISLGWVTKFGGKPIIRYIFVCTCLILILLFGIFDQSDFVYTQF